MKRCIYSNFIQIKNYRNKNIFNIYFDLIKESHQQYANDINVDYILFEDIENIYDLNLYEQINLAKYIHCEKLLQNYDEVLYIDFDIIPNTYENFFEQFNLQKYIPIKATLDFDCYPCIKQYDNTLSNIKHNQELENHNIIQKEFNDAQTKILQTYDLLTQRYWAGITEHSYHGRLWSEEKRPKQFEEELGLKWWYKKHNFDVTLVDRPFKTFKTDFIKIDSPSPDTINPWDDIVKFAAVDILTNSSTLYNTGVMGFSHKTYRNLDIINNIDNFKEKLLDIKSNKWPSYITKHIDFNNEVLFSFCLNNVNILHIDDSWNYFVDWDSGIINANQTSSFEDCKFRHYLNKNFEKQWTT